jgi:hypothetical protein
MPMGIAGVNRRVHRRAYYGAAAAAGAVAAETYYGRRCGYCPPSLVFTSALLRSALRRDTVGRIAPRNEPRPDRSGALIRSGKSLSAGPTWRCATRNRGRRDSRGLICPLPHISVPK